MNPVVARMLEAQRGSGAMLSVGLEPDPERLPEGFERSAPGCERMLRAVIDATAGLACAYKANLAFFEALGVAGWTMLERLRGWLPDGAVLIADGKRGDIGSTAARAASAVFDVVGADAATVNPLMGRDSAEPFLERADRLVFLLALTSNPGAGDFLLRDGLSTRIARTAQEEWNGRGNAGLVVGATRPELAGEVRGAAPGLPVLVPGLGAQGGDAARTARALGATVGAEPLCVFHVTRGLFEGVESAEGAEGVIRANADRYAGLTASAGAGGVGHG